jgi:HK97 family phage major capsid protein
MATREEAFRLYLRTGDPTELRAMGEQGSPGNIVAPEFSSEVIRLAKEYDSLFGDMEFYSTPNGAPMVRPSVQAFTLGASNPTEGVAIPTTGNDATYGQSAYSQQSFGEAYNVAVSLLVSNQLVQDAGVEIDALIAEDAAENLGRQLAVLTATGSGTAAPQGIIPALSSAGAWSAGNSGGYIALGAATVAPTVTNASGTELAQNVLSVQTLAGMIAAVDSAFLSDAKFYLNQAQWSNILLLADSQKRPLAVFADGNGSTGRSLLGFPVVLSSAIPNLAASTVGGPIFGNLRKAHTVRVVSPGVSVFRAPERYSEFLQTQFRVHLRCDARVRDARAAVTVKPAAT